mmetsp:Transcript_107004/g.345362  ORF Transcript_107004/g.345362 Transcript_107004/m.345362 type:complete len:202 (+) Transcript_107004:2431-3036(+)
MPRASPQSSTMSMPRSAQALETCSMSAMCPQTCDRMRTVAPEASALSRRSLTSMVRSQVLSTHTNSPPAWWTAETAVLPGGALLSTLLPLPTPNDCKAKNRDESNVSVAMQYLKPVYAANCFEHCAVGADEPCAGQFSKRNTRGCAERQTGSSASRKAVGGSCTSAGPGAAHFRSPAVQLQHSGIAPKRRRRQRRLRRKGP